MKKLKLLTAALVLSVYVIAQNVTFLSVPQKNKSNNSYSSVSGGLIGKIDNKLYFSSAKSNNLGKVTEKSFTICDATTLKVLDTKIFNDDHKDKLYDENIYDIINGQMFSISHDIPEGKGKDLPFEYKIVKYNKATLLPEGETELFTFNRPRSKVYSDPIYTSSSASPDKNFYVFSILNRESGKYGVAAIDKDLKVLWTAEGVKKVTNSWAHMTANINNDGEVALLVEDNDDSKSKYRNYVLTYDNKGGPIGDMEITAKGKMLFKTLMVIGNEGEFFIGGTTIAKYESDNYAAASGVFYTKVSDDLKEQDEATVIPFEGDKKGNFSSLLALRGVFPNEEGGVIIVLENWGWSQSSKGRMQYSYGQNLIVNIGSKGASLFPLYKSIGSTTGCDAVGPLVLYKNGKLYFLYNENHDNFDKMEPSKLNNRVCQDTDIILATCDVEAGTYEKTQLAARLSKDFMFIDYPSTITDGNDVYFQSTVKAYQGEGGLGKLSFDKK